MALSEKEQVLQHLYRVRPTAGIVEWDAFVIDLFERALELPRMEAEQRALPSVINKYWDHLIERLDEDRAAGRSPIFDIHHEATKKLRWHYEGFTTSHPQRAVCIRRRAEVLAAIDALSWRQYEALGGYACRVLGADRVEVTRGGGDGGVDFLACITIRRDSHVFSGGGARLRIVGQSKRYTTALKVGSIRDFVTTINDVKGQTPPVVDHVPDWFYSSPGPIVGWMACHSGFQAGAASKARHNGILVTDSIDYAEIIANCRPLRGNDPFAYLTARVNELLPNL